MNRRGISSTALLAAAAGLAVASHAPAAILNWASAVTGTASTAARWSPAQVPTAADDLVFNATAGAQAFTATFDAATATSRTMSFRQDTITLGLTATHTTTNGVAIADLAGDVSTVTLSSGTWNCGNIGTVNIGDAAGSTGTFNVAGSAAHFAAIGPTQIMVGNNGTGTLNITGTGDVTCNNHLHVGQGGAAVGNLTVSGALAIAPFGRSTLTVNGTLESHWGNGGDATVSIASGALAHLVGDLVIGTLSTSIANVTVGGTGGIGGLTHATLDVDSDLFIGRNNSAAVLPGTGTLNVNSGGDLTVGGTINLGNDPDGGGSGTLNINSGALVDAASVAIGPTGSVNHTGGTLKINGGTFTGHADPLDVSGTGSPTLQLSNNLSKTIAPAGAVGLIVGDDLGAGTWTGNLTIDTGADLILSGVSKDINIGDDAGTTGTILVDGAGSRLIANQPGDDIRVGFNGDGTLLVDHGAQVLADNVLVPATSVGGTGLLAVSNGGASLTTANLSVGNSSGGTGQVTINPGGTITASNPGIGVLVRTTGQLHVTVNATLNATGAVTLTGGLMRVGGTANADTVDVQSGTLRSLNGGTAALINAQAHLRNTAALEVIDADLTMGTTASNNGVIFDSGSTVTVGSGRTLTLLDNSNIVADGRIVLQGGTIQPANGRFIDMGGAAADQLSGQGTIAGNIVLNDLGTVAPSGTGLVFTDTTDITNAVDIVGTAIRFAGGSTLRDFGSGHTFNCKITADAGSVFQPNTVSSRFNTQAFGPITMGDGSSTGVTLNGTIHMGTNGSLTFNDTFATNLGALTDMNGGSITNTTGLNLTSGRVLRGHGTINVAPSGTGFQISPLATIDPDAYFSDTDSYHGIGTFLVNGRYAQATGGTYLCELAGFDNEFRPLNDRIDVNGPAVLAGTLDVSLIDGYQATRCDTFTILTAASITGEFQLVNKPHNVVVVYNPTSVQLLVSGCVADVDDGSFTGTPDCGVTIDDLLYYLAIFEAGTLDADVDDGSFTGTHDSGVTIDDLLYYLFRFEAGC